MVEAEETPNLVPLMLHFATVLGPRWTVILYTLEATWTPPESPAFHRALQAGHLDVRYLPASTSFANSTTSSFLASPWLWEQLEDARHVLLWQTDSVICSKAPQMVDDFLKYDFVGAPIAEGHGEGYNGGLSLRNPKVFLDIARKGGFAGSGVEVESQWFYQELKARAEEGRAVLPSAEVATRFSVESVYYESPIGYHQPARWQKEHMEQIEERCPEVRMLVGQRVK